MTETEHFHLNLADDAQQLWVGHMARCEDDGIEADDGATLLSVAAAMCQAHVLAWGEYAGRIIPDDLLRDMVADFEATMLKTIADIAPSSLTDETRRRMSSLDRRLKRERDLPTESGGEA